MSVSWRIRVTCPGCKRESRVPGNFVGHAGLCPGCLDPLRVPDPGRAPASAQAALAELPAPPPSHADDLAQARWGIKVGWVEDSPQPAGSDDLPANCVACGEPLRLHARVCEHCGEFQRAEDRLAERSEGDLGAPGWRRAAALLLNLLLLAPGAGLLSAALAAFEGWAGIDRRVLLPAAALGLGWVLLVVYLQFRLLLTQRTSLGKRWLGLRLIHISGRPAETSEVLLREGMFWLLVSPLCAGLGLVIHGLSAILVLIGQPRTLHDLVAGTVVILDPQQASE